jgi:hypothetical protein
VAGNRWKRGEEEFVPLYEGKMVQAFDHRAASVVVNPENVHRPAVPLAATPAQHADVTWQPTPQFWVPAGNIDWLGIPPSKLGWAIGFKDVTSPTNMRTMISAIIPFAGVGNTLPLVMPEQVESLDQYKEMAPLMLANLNSFALDFVARQKVQGQHLNWYIVEQLPVLSASTYETSIGTTTAADLVRQEVLKLTYASHDMQPFAQDMGYDGPPFAWDEDERRHARARLDALYFLLYGLGRDDAAYILDTFPIVREQDMAACGRFRTKDLVLGYMAAFAAGDAASRVEG